MGEEKFVGSEPLLHPGPALSNGCDTRGCASCKKIIDVRHSLCGMVHDPCDVGPRTWKDMKCPKNVHVSRDSPYSEGGTQCNVGYMSRGYADAVCA